MIVSEEPGKIFKAMADIFNDVQAVPKDRKNQQQGYKFRGIDDVYQAIHDVMAKHKVFMVPEVIGDPRRQERTTQKGGVLFYVMLTVKYTFYAIDGSSVSAVVEGEAMDSGDKATNKAMSAAQKYVILQTFCIPTEDDNDTENKSHDVAPRKSAPEKAPAPAKKGRSAEEYIESIKAHFKLFTDAYDEGIATSELLSASEFEATDRETGEKTGEMIAGYSSPEEMETKATARGLDKATGRLRVICHIIEASWKKALKEESEKS